jgi:hypothetical protein
MSNTLTALVSSNEAGSTLMALSVTCLSSGAVQVRLEEEGMAARWESPDIVVKDGLTPAEDVGVLSGDDASAAKHLSTSAEATVLAFTADTGKQVQVVVEPSPLQIKVFVDSQLLTAVNTL